jgi:hypothetical protein
MELREPFTGQQTRCVYDFGLIVLGEAILDGRSLIAH